MRWVAMHSGGDHKCDGEAFSYATFTRPEKTFIGAIIYHRGRRPFEITHEMVVKQNDGLRCEKCSEFIMAETDITPAPEIFKVKSLMRYLKIVSDWRNALEAVAAAHIRLLEYGHLLDITYEVWKEQQDVHDKHLKGLESQLGHLHNFCAGIGPCEARPSQIVLGKRTGPTPLSELQGHGIGGKPVKVK